MMRKISAQRKASLEFEINFYKKLIEACPLFIDALVPLASAYTDIGQYEQGLSIDLKLAELRPTDETVFYNLACSYALLNMKNEAFRALAKAIDLGYKDYRHLNQDADLSNLRPDARFEQIRSLLRGML